MKKKIIDGANGYVASYFVLELLRRGYQVVALVRENGLKTAEERMYEKLEEICREPIPNLENLSIYQYSLLDKDMDVGPSRIRDVFHGPVDFFHFAASLKYREEAKYEIFKTNIEGLENAIQTFRQHAAKSSRFFFIGTAYSCGKYPHLFEEKFYPNAGIQQFRNYYEQSKRYAENVLKTYIEEKGLNGYLFRLGQVVGNKKTSEVHTSYGLFNVVKKLYYLSSAFPDQTLRIRIDPEATQNLIPIDVLVDYMIKAIEAPKLPRIIHFVAKTPMRNQDILQCICEQMPISVIPKKQLKREELGSLEGMIADRMHFSGSYTSTHINFDTSNLEKVIQRNPVEMDEKTLSRMLHYYLQKLEEEIQTLNPS